MRNWPVDHIVSMFKSGMTQQEIADAFRPITRQRIQQILKSNGIRREHGGSFVRWKNSDEARKTVEENCFRMWGITRAEKLAIRMDFGTAPFVKYRHQRHSAKRRGIKFLLTFGEWWSLWQSSGKWAKRGIYKGQYVMSRPGDKGAYEIGNVKICLSTENTQEHYEIARRRKAITRPAPST